MLRLKEYKNKIHKQWSGLQVALLIFFSAHVLPIFLGGGVGGGGKTSDIWAFTERVAMNKDIGTR